MNAIASYVAIFVVVVGSLFILIYSHSEIMKTKIGTMEETYILKQEQLSTDFEITRVEHIDEIKIELMNRGGTKLKPELTKVYMPQLINSTNSLDSSFNLINPLLWDPGEKLLVFVEDEIEFNINKSITISTENGISKKINFQVKEEILHLNSAKLSNNETELKEKLNLSEDEAIIEIETDEQIFLYLNYSLNQASIQNSTVTIEHYFSNVSNINAFLEFQNKDGWNTLSELSYFETKNIDRFQNLEETLNYRIRFISNNINTIFSYIDIVEINSNVTRWWTY
jgi:hypothetical protein